MLLAEAIKKLKPSKYFNINVHIDGLARTHDAIAGRGVFERAANAIRAAKQAGFKVCTNTTIYKNTSEDEIKELFAFLEGLGVDGMLVSPGFSFEHNENEIFLCRKEVQEKFGFIYGISKEYKILNSPLYLKFLKGERHLKCTQWGIQPETIWAGRVLATSLRIPTIKPSMSIWNVRIGTSIRKE